MPIPISAVASTQQRPHERQHRRKTDQFPDRHPRYPPPPRHHHPPQSLFRLLPIHPFNKARRHRVRYDGHTRDPVVLEHFVSSLSCIVD
jgi:hypothetical protein